MNIPNSSGSQERFVLAAGASKTYQVASPGGSLWEVSLANLLDQGMAGEIKAGGTTTVTLATSEDGTTFTSVDSAAVVPGGAAILRGLTGRYAKFSASSGGSQVVVVAKPSARVQPLTFL